MAFKGKSEEGTEQETVAPQQETGVTVPAGTDLTTELRRFDGDTLRNITSLADVFALATESGVPMESVENYGDGFELLKDKNRLVGQGFGILQWSFHKGDYTDKMVVAHVVTEDGGKYIIVDGSTGIRDQLREVTNERIRSGSMSPVEAQTMLLCKKGLTVSEYRTDRNTGNIVPRSEYDKYPSDQLIPGATFYLA